MSSPDKQSMGDLFLQRRRAAAAANNNNAATSSHQSSMTSLTPLSQSGGAASNGGGGDNNRKKSFLEIQREQEQQLQRERQQQQREQKQSFSSNRSSSSGVGGGGSSYDSSSRHQQQYQRSSSSSQQQQQQRSLYNPNSYSNNNNNSSSSRRGGGNRTSQSRSNLPLEQGVIHTLLDKFGFILCADRNIELFFHYSEYRGIKDGTGGHHHVDDLNIGDEVEFRVGSEPKLAALDVKQIPKGTIYWEKEDDPDKVYDGYVEMSCMREDNSGRRGGGKKGGGDGIIRLKEVDNDDNGGDDDNLEEIYYTSSDYKPNKKHHHNRLERKDIIQFSLVTQRRTGKKFARNITLIQSERERQRLEREAKLLENATLERGKVVSCKGDYGFLQSVERVEQVYFHISHVAEQKQQSGNDDDEGTNDDDGGGEGASSLKRMSSSSLVLTEGQEVEFFVVNDVASGGGGGRGGGGGNNKKGGKSLSARKIKLLPKGTVKFEHELAQGVTGYVIECPVEASADPFFGGGGGNSSKKSDRGGNSGGSTAVSAVMGKISLDTPLVDTKGNQVTEVTLCPDLYPCGTFAISRTGGDVGIWIRPGDTLLFDVIQTIADGTYRAMPTKYTQCLSLRSAETSTANNEMSSKAMIRLIKPSLCGRAEGVIRSIRDNYGFIHSAERNVDVYFPLFEVLPNEIHKDLVENNPSIYHGNDPVVSKAGRTHVEVGMEVSFDLSLQILTNTGSGGRGGGGRSRQNNFGAQEKESLRGRRLQILPKGTVQEKILVASQVKATVSKVDLKQPFVGTIELEDALTIQSTTLRHPLATKLLDTISEGSYGDEVTFHDVLSEKDLQVVTSMVKNRDDLEWLYVPVSGENANDPHNRKLRIVRKVQGEDVTSELPERKEGEEEDGVVAEKEENVKGEVDDASTKDETSVDAAIATDDSEKASSKLDSKKKAKRGEKLVNTLRYDKNSFPDMSDGPLGVGDVITCDIFLSRRSGAVLAENIVVLERKERPTIVSDGEGETKPGAPKDLKGFVTEVVPSRQFGFITAVDEEGLKTGEHVFFHFKSVGSEDDSKKAMRSDIVRKGDEVKFVAGIGKNGKLSATNITILPRGTLKMAAKVDKATTCTGYILMEPSHTSLANTPSHIVYKSSGPSAEGGTGRWDNVKEARFGDNKSGSSVIEQGIILLLSDPSHLFSPTAPKKNGTVAQPADLDSSPQDKVEETKSSVEAVGATDDAKEDDGEGNESKENETATPNATLGIRVRYKSSSIAFRNPAGAILGGPKRGDLVTFGKTRGANLVKDIRVEEAGAATNVAGILEDINTGSDAAVFVSAANNQRYEIHLSEVVSCHKSLLQDKEKVDGILHEGHIYGGEQ